MASIADPVESYSEIITRIFEEWENWPGPEAHFKLEPVLDHANGRYLLVTVGWDKSRRIYGTLIHIDIIDGKLWIQRDNTEEGVASKLLAAGIPRERIVLAFYPEKVREYGDFAVA